MSVYFVSLKGERNRNEDKHTIYLGMNKDNCPNVNLYAVYDGHGGKFVSRFLSDNLPKFFTHSKVKYPLTKAYVNQVYDKLQNILFTKYEKDATSCGSTCVTVIHFIDGGKNYLNILNTGDSRCVICRNNLAIPLTIDHKPNWPNEKRRINQAGGEIYHDGHDWRVNDLSVSRAFGDKESKKYVTHRSDLYKYRLTNKDRFIILACDGLWDVMSNQDAVNFVLDNCYDIQMNSRINHNVNIARRLAEYAINLDTTDNVTVIVVFFD